MRIAKALHDEAVASVANAGAGLRPVPRSLEETGLSFLSLVELLTKILFLRGQLRLIELSAHIKLPSSLVANLLGFMRTERLCEVVRRGGTDGDVDYQLTEAGRMRAAGYLARNQYAGAAPVSLDAYVQVIGRQSVAGMRVTRQDVARDLHGVVVEPQVRDQLGAAMNSGRAIFLYGPSGSGKTFLAERLHGLLHGRIAIPYAITVDDEVIQVFDPIVHTPVPTDARAGNPLDGTAHFDARWVECRRPVAITGGELTLAMLDLDFDRSAGYYRAPPHLKANNGILIVDDLGRQLVSPRELMNRWIVPLDRRRDYLTFHSGYKFMVPFDVLLIFATNLDPADLADPAFVRRLGHKIHVGALAEEAYRAIFQQVCADLGIKFVETAFEYLLRNRHDAEQRPLLACYPRDLLGQVRDHARYEGIEPHLTPQALDRAWDRYFVAQSSRLGASLDYRRPHGTRTSTAGNPPSTA